MLFQELKDIKSTNKDLRNFGLVVGVFFLILATIFYWYNKNFTLYFGVIGALLVVLGFVLPKILLPLQKVWMAIALIMGFVMTRVILLILFYFILAPIGLIARLFRKQFLDFTFKSQGTTYWNLRQNDQLSKESHEQQF